jgi:hypothetical protein
MQPAATGVVEEEGHAPNSRVGAPRTPTAGQAPIESALAPWGSAADGAEHGAEMEVLRWLLFFVIALFLIVAAIFFVMGRGLPLPTF